MPVHAAPSVGSVLGQVEQCHAVPPMPAPQMHSSDPYVHTAPTSPWHMLSFMGSLPGQPLTEPELAAVDVAVTVTDPPVPPGPALENAALTADDTSLTPPPKPVPTLLTFELTSVTVVPPPNPEDVASVMTPTAVLVPGVEPPMPLPDDDIGVLDPDDELGPLLTTSTLPPHEAAEPTTATITAAKEATRG
jgi:hypothetical protein